MIAMSGQDFKTFVDVYSSAYDVVRSRIIKHSGVLFKDGFVRQIASTKRQVSFTEVNPGSNDGLYEMVIGLDVRIIPNSSAPKEAREVNYRENIPTGLIFTMDENGQLIDANGLETGADSKVDKTSG